MTISDLAGPFWAVVTLNISEILAAATSNGVTSGRKVNTGYHFQLMYSSLTTGSRLMGETGAFSDP